VHLIEIDLSSCEGTFDWEALTQKDPALDPGKWQAPYDEAPVPNTKGRWRFFFHHLDPRRPLSSSYGDLPLPAESEVPAHLRFVRYRAP
jgi:hypothetical protein